MEDSKFTRRKFMHSAGMLGLAGLAGGGINKALADSGGGAGTAASPQTATLPFEHGERVLAQYPQKRPLMILTSNGLQLETPFSVFDENIITPNDAFFVRYHNSRNPLSINGAQYRLSVGGNVTTSLSLSLADLKSKFTPVELVAVCACTGNSRGFNKPRVPGGQWAHGAMGNARWKGVRLKDVLDMAGVGNGAVQVTFNGMDQGAKPSVPDFVKALDIDFARNSDALLAYEMNGADLPVLNGYPVRLVVPGYTGTYWVKHLTEINVIDTVFDGFYMGVAYREPDNDCACVPPGTAPAATRPVTKPRIRSFITNLIEGANVAIGTAVTVRGFAFDGGTGIAKVEFSNDGGATWKDAVLGEDLGKYAARAWSTQFTAGAAGPLALKVKATAVSGETQPVEQFWQPTGYGYNPIETVNVTAI